MAEPDSVIVKLIGPFIGTAIGGLIGLLPGGLTGVLGSAFTGLLVVAGGIAGLVFHLMYKRYVGVLGAGGGRKGYPARDAYDSLRESLLGGNLAEQLYARWLNAILDAVDRFLGDAGMADRTLFPHAFGLRTPAPLWTAPTFNQCLLLGLIYLPATIFVVWALSGHVGPMEAVWGLTPDVAAWRRGLFLATVSLLGFAGWRAGHAFKTHTILEAIVVGAFAVAIVVVSFFVFLIAQVGAAADVQTVVLAVAIAGSLSFVFAGVGAVARTYIAKLVVAAVAGVVVFAIALAGTGTAFFALPLAAVAFSTSGALSEFAETNRRQGVFLLLFVFIMIFVCFCAAYLLPPLSAWQGVSLLLLFLLLLTVLNAPFDWASLGLTRALLRRGLELGGWWPYVLAVADAVLAAGTIVLLAITIVLGVQSFDHLAEHSGSSRIFPLDQLFDGIAAHPTAPEYWWIYALLLLTMIPSLIDLVIGGASLVRGLPGASPLLLHFMPVGKAAGGSRSVPRPAG